MTPARCLLPKGSKGIQFEDLERAREDSEEMRRRGELRPLRYKQRIRKKKRISGGSKRFPGA